MGNKVNFDAQLLSSPTSLIPGHSDSKDKKLYLLISTQEITWHLCCLLTGLM